MISPLYIELCSWENLLLSYKKASKGKRGKSAAASFEYRLEDNLINLQNELLEKSYCPGTYHSFYIHDPKRRLISAALFRDRVVHHALCNIIEPIFERSFIYDSYANRVGKGTHRAIDRAQEFSRYYRYVLPCDIRLFFPSIDHEIMKDILADKIQDENILWLINCIIDGGRGVQEEVYDTIWFPGDDLFTPCRFKGLPIGNLTSQFWANCYLNSLDHFIKRELRCHGYVRYVDDILLYGNDKTQMWEWKRAIINRLQGLRVKIHETRAQVRPVCEGISFLGFLLFPHKRKLKRRKGVKYSRKLRRLARQYNELEIPLNKVTASVEGWVNHTRYGDTYGLRKAIFENVVFVRGGS